MWWSAFNVILAVLASDSCIRTAYALLSPPNQVWVSKFDPPYDNRTLLVELAVYDWWGNYHDSATIPEGTAFPVLDSYCNYDPNKCPSWTTPGDVKFQFGPSTLQDVHHLILFLTDTGISYPVYGAPYESVSAGCTGATGSICCNGQQWTLQRDQTDHEGFVMWVSRVNGTVTNDGTQAPNFRSAGAQLTISTGSYSATISWPNMFFQSTGQASDPKLTAHIEFAADSTSSSYLDVISPLTENYTLLIPVNDLGAPGFVVPNANLGEPATPLDVVSWSACRANSCGAPIGACVPSGQQISSPFAAWRNTTSATIIANAWNSLGGTWVKKSCSVLGNGHQAFINADLSVGDQHAVQYVGCDYNGTYIVPVIDLPRSIIESGNTVSPPALSSPSGTSSAAPVSSSSSAIGQGASSPLSNQSGPAVYVLVQLPTYTPTSFNASGRDVFTQALQTAAIGASAAPTVRIRSVTTPSGQRKLLASSSGTVVDAVVEFAPTDTTAASLLITLLKTTPDQVFPPGQFGQVIVLQAAALNCITPCGAHGHPAPRDNGAGGVSCTCECDPGWITLPNQAFESFVYCTGTANALGDTAGPGTGVPLPPPPAPTGYIQGGSRLSAGSILVIVICILLICVLVYISWRTRCCCCISACKLSVTAVEKGHNAVVAWVEKKKAGVTPHGEEVNKPLEEGAQSSAIKPAVAQKPEIHVVQVHAESAGAANAKESHPPQLPAHHIGISIAKKAKKKHRK